VSSRRPWDFIGTRGNRRVQYANDKPARQDHASIAPALSGSEQIIRLEWVPMGFPWLRPPAGQTVVQCGLWWRLFWAMFDHGEPQGYLPATSNLQLLTGSRDALRWEAQRSGVMAAFETAQIAGQEFIFFPPLIHALETQRRKLLNKRGRGGISKSQSSVSEPLSLSLDLDFDSKNNDENSEKNYARIPKKTQGSESKLEQFERVLRERRARRTG
jgi:hypothetical protein